MLSTPPAWLFFVLFSFKCYPLQEVMGMLFGLNQPQVCLWIGRLRVRFEYTISGVKRCRIVADTLCNWRAGMVDAVMLAASGLHNLRVAARA